jgi:predicted nicotinamide N-methyase
MYFNYEWKVFSISETALEIYVPKNANSIGTLHSPYWAKVWPAAIGLCRFLASNNHYIKNKKVIELAAGLGLPSLFSAAYAKQVYATDIEPVAVSLINESVKHNQLSNLSTAVLDWQQALELPKFEVVLLSDVNYEPNSFSELYKVIINFIERGTTIILSTPQRLMAKPFIDQLLVFCVQRDEIQVQDQDIETAISIFVLQQGNKKAE